ncbi:MAG: hypothetical protein Q8T09_08315 [Candidatus Melainabacteria bacterium]|nr:hypothetical protein [Candidatus Melainabacteria bacterium]
MNITSISHITEILFLQHLLDTASRFAAATPVAIADTAAANAVEERRKTLAKISATAQFDLDQATFWVYESFNFKGLAPAQLLKRMKALHQAGCYIELCHRSIRQAMLISTDVSPPYEF